ncbi:hypothetical protein HDU97_009411 [Phlyctochytrium planicorne]|nr:hypothetical protein HDU97_009411 [Phlyctochytrium planicorne]
MDMFKEFSLTEKRNIFIYTTGLVFYKFVLETLGACMSGIVLNRLGYDPVTKKAGPSTGLTWTAMQSINLTCQCLGSLLIGPLVKRFRAGTIITSTTFAFSAALLIIPTLEGATGGRMPQVNTKGSSIPSTWGSWSPYLLYLFFPLFGFFTGMIDLMRRVIPNDIVGGDPTKLKKMDATVHLFWEIAGTTGAIFSVTWISYFGWGFVLVLISVGFMIAGAFFIFIRPREERIERERELVRMAAESGKPRTFASEIAEFSKSFLQSIWIGAKLVCTQRALFWLLPAYTLPLVLHRYLEGTIFPFYARSTLLNSDLQNILTGGSNFGEAMGAVLVLVFARKIKTPIPYLRLDAILILLVWIVPFYSPASPADATNHAWSLAPIMAIISFGWSCGDVALAAYVQSRLNNLEEGEQTVSPLGAVMSFLYVVNLVVYFTLNNFMGRVRDDYINNGKSLTELYVYVAATAMTAGGVVVFACTFLPKGSWAWNPDPEAEEFDGEIILNGKRAKKINEFEGEDKQEGGNVEFVAANRQDTKRSVLA